MPLPVDDSVVVAWKERYAILVSGWSQDDNVTEVQVYDALSDAWHESTPIPGRSVFGHAGALVGDTLVYCDGVRVEPNPPEDHSRFYTERSCWEGRLGGADASTIAWRRLPDHPGSARYRMAAGALGDWAVFVGGSATAYNYDGIGYEGEPAEPEAALFAWSVSEERWLELGPAPLATMDHRTLAPLGRSLYLVGGMSEKRQVSDQAFLLERAR